jgi:hypothetical protein
MEAAHLPPKYYSRDDEGKALTVCIAPRYLAFDRETCASTVVSDVSLKVYAHAEFETLCVLVLAIGAEEKVREGPGTTPTAVLNCTRVGEQRVTTNKR